jgi:hypothetical protein
MKFVKWIVVPSIILVVLGFAIYQFGLSFAIDKVSEEFESSGKMDQVREIVKNDPALEKFIKEVETSPEFQQMIANQSNPPPSDEQEISGAETEAQQKQAHSSGQPAAGNNNTAKASEMDKLPFETKEEAIEEVVDRIGMPKLYDMYDRVQTGATSKEEIITEVSNEFSEKEITALKIIAYQELYGK